MIDIREYLDRGGHSPFREWRSRLSAEARRKVTTALYRVGLANFSNVKGVGAGVFEARIDFGPGVQSLFWKRWRTNCHPSWWRHETASVERHPSCIDTVARLQAKEETSGTRE